MRQLWLTKQVAQFGAAASKLAGRIGWSELARTGEVADRLDGNPMIQPSMLTGTDGDNINGPCLVRIPDWVSGALGRYYLYFAHHSGSYIRLAFADDLNGPWAIYRDGVLSLSQTPFCRDHIASPDVHLQSSPREFRMYYHGVSASDGKQRTYVALSDDGLRFRPSSTPLAPFYLRALPLDGRWIGLAKGGSIHVSRSGLEPFDEAPRPLFKRRSKMANSNGDVRHVALHKRGHILFVYFTKIGDAPERIYRCQVDLRASPTRWRAGQFEEILRPVFDWEGAAIPLSRSRPGPSAAPENAVRDPALLEDGGYLYLAYAIAGESGIAIAKLSNLDKLDK